MAKKQTITNKILELLNKDLNRPAKEIAKIVGTSASYVYAVKHNSLKTYAEKNKAAIARHVYPNDPVYEDSRLHLSNGVIEKVAKELGPNPAVQPFDKPEKWVTAFLGTTIAKADITNLTDEQIGRLRLNLEKPKQRMQGRQIENPQIEMIEPQIDPVNHPPHYKAGGIETIDFIEAKKLNYNLGNVVKYITRSDLKGNRQQDLEKALWYLNRELGVK
jgi:DNA-binding Lrp family transcriptional regulator